MAWPVMHIPCLKKMGKTIATYWIDSNHEASESISVFSALTEQPGLSTQLLDHVQ